VAKTNYTPEEPKHTPTPWTVQACYSGATTIATMRSPDRIICINAPYDATPAGYEATETNAAFLVEACNSYDDLRSRLLAAEQRAEEIERCLAVSQGVVATIRAERDEAESRLALSFIEVVKPVADAYVSHGERYWSLRDGIERFLRERGRLE
jgi:hypothetical protein